MVRHVCYVPHDRSWTKHGWRDIHNQHVRLLNKIRPETILIGDSIVRGLSRYPKVWNNSFNDSCLNLGIGGDRTQHVLWRCRNLPIPSSLKFCVVHCGTNNISTDSKYDICKGLTEICNTLINKKPDLKILIVGLLPRDNKWSSIREKIASVNDYVSKVFNDKSNIMFLKPDLNWTLPSGELDHQLYYMDKLHLVEQGNIKLAKLILRGISKL